MFKSIFPSTAPLGRRYLVEAWSVLLSSEQQCPLHSEHHSFRGKFLSSAALHAFILQKAEVSATGGVQF